MPPMLGRLKPACFASSAAATGAPIVQAASFVSSDEFDTRARRFAMCLRTLELRRDRPPELRR
jgi:hypothetical protein